MATDPDSPAPPEGEGPKVATPGFRTPRAPRRATPGETPQGPPPPAAATAAPHPGPPLEATPAAERPGSGAGLAGRLARRRTRTSSRGSTEPGEPTPLDATTLRQVKALLSETIRFGAGMAAGLANRAHVARTKAESDKWIPTRAELNLFGSNAAQLVQRRLELTSDALDTVNVLGMTMAAGVYGFRNVTGVDLGPADEELREQLSDSAPAFTPSPRRPGSPIPPRPSAEPQRQEAS